MTRDSQSRFRSISIPRSLILAWQPVTPSSRRMLVRVSVVVVPTIDARRSSVTRIARMQYRSVPPIERLHGHWSTTSEGAAHNRIVLRSTESDVSPHTS
jgi:hypothetical protein